MQNCAQEQLELSRILAATDRPEFFIVPGGRYMVSCSRNGIFVWNLGYTSSADCKLIASCGLEGGLEPGGYYPCIVQPTPDGMGLIIFSPYIGGACSVYEIYPQSETPQLTRIAHLDSNPAGNFLCLLPDRVLWYFPNGYVIVFRVWDYRTNYSTSFSVDLDFNIIYRIFATKTAIFLPWEQGILIWAIPPLSPQLLDSFDDNPTHISLLFSVAYPDGTVRPTYDGVIASQTMSHWYYDSSQPLYFGMLRWKSTLHRFKIIVKPDLLDSSLHIINTELVPRSFPLTDFETYRICEGTHVASWQVPGRWPGTYIEGQFATYAHL